jgi:hypothetical protein
MTGISDLAMHKPHGKQARVADVPVMPVLLKTCFRYELRSTEPKRHGHANSKPTHNPQLPGCLISAPAGPNRTVICVSCDVQAADHQ